MMDLQQKTGEATTASDVASDVMDVTTANFMADVVEASQTRLVVVDFWAEWCAPCKQLTPMLEAAVTEVAATSQDQLRLAKVNVDENQALAQQLRVQSLPTVYFFAGGQPLDGFVGVKPKAELVALIQQFVQTHSQATGGQTDPATQLEAAATALSQGDVPAALNAYQGVLAQEPDNETAVAGVLRCLLVGRDLATARHIVDNMPPTLKDSKTVAELVNSLAMTEAAVKRAGDLPRLEADAKNKSAKPATFHALAQAQYGAGQTVAAIDTLLKCVANDKKDEAARKQLLDIFAAMGNTIPEVRDGRRRLSSLLFA